MSTIKFRKCFTKFMIPIALMEKFGRETSLSSVEVRNMRKTLGKKFHKHEENYRKTFDLFQSFPYMLLNLATMYRELRQYVMK